MPNRKTHVLQKLYSLHNVELRQFLIQRVGIQEAADLLQETWLHFLRLADVEAVHAPRAFLYKTAANIATDYSRKKRPINFTESELEHDDMPCPFPTPESIADAHWQFERFTEVLQELPSRQQQAFIMNKMEGLTHAEIAIKIGISEKSVQRLIMKAFQHCIKQMAI
ncbi:MAG: sigma-70 family RNA polymerase sigma factor [Methylococcaceae bacterium]|jgi:RNA polymerase sigma-70 factor (ECF subfamily)